MCQKEESKAGEKEAFTSCLILLNSAADEDEVARFFWAVVIKMNSKPLHEIYEIIIRLNHLNFRKIFLPLTAFSRSYRSVKFQVRKLLFSYHLSCYPPTPFLLKKLYF